MKHFSFEIRVRYAETDQMGVSYYSNYFVWFEVARTEFLRAQGVVYTDFEKRGIILPVLDAQCTYLNSTAYDDVIVVTICASEIKRSSLHFQYKVTRKSDGILVAQGTTAHAFTDKKFKPVRVPEEVRKVIEVSNLF